MSNNETGYKRRHYFIKKEFQFKFILKFCLILLAGILVSTALVYLLSMGTLTSSYENSKLVIENTARAIMPTLIMTNLITSAVIVLAAIAVTLFISHRLAGPMFRFEKDLRRVGDGDLRTRIQLRKKDQLAHIALEFNRMTENTHHKIIQIDGEIDRILADETRDPADSDLRQQVKDLKKMIHDGFSL